MRILQVSTVDLEGGAEKIAWNLHRKFRSKGHQSKLVVGIKRSNDPDVLQIDNSQKGKGLRFLKTRAEMHLGVQSFDYPGSHRIPELAGKWDVAHFHNLHGNYFDLAAIKRLTTFGPAILTMHDMWLLTGHCAHPLGSERFRLGCGSCCDLSIYPAVRRDATRFNLKRKKRLLGRLPIAISSPANWLLKEVSDSYLGKKEKRFVPNPVDTQWFRPGDSGEARRQLRLPRDKPVILYPANVGLTNHFKDPRLFLNCVQRLSDLGALGVVFGSRPDEFASIANLAVVPSIHDEETMAKYYQAADVVVSPSVAETAPLTVIEAMSSGKPIVATRVGGIREIVENDRTGLLVEQGDVGGFADAVRRLLTDRNLAHRFGEEGARQAHRRYDLDLVADLWLDWYVELLDRSGRKVNA